MRFTKRLLALGAILSLALAGRTALAQDEGLPLPVVTHSSRARPTAPRASSNVPSTVTTGFDPRINGLPFGNPGDFAEPEGNCFGMSAVAVDNFLRRQAASTGSAPVATPIAEGIPDADAPKEVLVSTEQSAIEAKDDNERGPIHEVPLHDPSAIDAALDRIAKTGQPEVLTISGKEDGHATVLYGYENGKLQIYDPNYPGETVQWPFDPVKGFGPHPKGSDDSFYKTLKTAGSTPLSALTASKDLAELRASPSALASADATRYPKISVKATPAANGNVAVTGSVSRGPTRTDEGEPTTPASRVWVVVNGKPVTQAKVVRGSFKVTLPESALTDASGEPSDVRVVATSSMRDGRTLFAGYADTTLEIPRTGIIQKLAPVSGKAP